MRRPRKALVAVVVAAGVVGLVGGGALMVLRGSATTAATCPRGGAQARAAVPSAVPGASAVPGSAGSVPALVISAPPSAPTGSSVTVRISAPAQPDGAPVRLAVLRGDVPAVRDATFGGGTATIELDPTLTAAAGRLSLQALSCDGAASAWVELRAGAAVGPLLPLVGPRRIETGSGRDATVVVVVQDVLGNAVEAGTAVDVTALRPDGTTEHQVVRTADLLAVGHLVAGTAAGDTVIAVTLGDIRGSGATLSEMPGKPVPGFGLSIAGPATATVGERTRRIVLRDLTDVNGNRMPDGTLVTILVTEPDGTVRSEQAPLIAGGVDLRLESPAVPGLVRVQLRVADVASAVATTWYGRPAVAVPVPLTATYDPDIRAIRVAVGPIVDALGAFAPDGSEVVLTASGAHGWVDQRVLRLTGGAATAQIPVADGETRVQLFVRSPFGRTDTAVAIP